METWNPVEPASTAAARPGSDRAHSTTIRRHPGIRNALPVVFATTAGYFGDQVGLISIRG